MTYQINSTTGKPEKASIAATLDACTHQTGFDLLPQRAKKVYLDRCLQLIREGRMKEDFLDQLVLYANAYDAYLAADESVRKLGQVLQKSGERSHEPIYYANPAVKMRMDSLRDVVRIGRNFSFSPLDRKSADLPITSPVNDPAASFLERRARPRAPWGEPYDPEREAKEKAEKELNRKAAKRREEAAITRIYTRYGLKRDKELVIARTLTPSEMFDLDIDEDNDY